jgi:hypothetical protein
MKKDYVVLSILIVWVCIIQLSCAVPRLLWPQVDIQPYELNAPWLEKKILVASRSSEFKDAVVEKIREAFKDEPVYMRFIGINQLEQEHDADYTAVVLINTCIAWGMDPDVVTFLDHYEGQGNIIVLTTSGDGDWLPDMGGRTFDAISSASEKPRIDGVADEIINKIRLLLI